MAKIPDQPLQPVVVLTTIFLNVTVMIEVYKGEAIYTLSYDGNTFRSEPFTLVDDALTFALASIIRIKAGEEI